MPTHPYWVEERVDGKGRCLWHAGRCRSRQGGGPSSSVAVRAKIDMAVPVTENVRAVSHVRRSTALVLMTALALSVAAQCLVGQEMTAAQMACCAGTDHDCNSVVTADCCRSEQADREQFVTAIQQLVSPPALASTAIAALVWPRSPERAASGHDATELQAPSPPKYVLLASFLI